jgi:hypothetical protein
VGHNRGERESIRLLLQFPTLGAITSLLCEKLVAQALKLVSRKVHKAALLADIYAAAKVDCSAAGDRQCGHSDVPARCSRTISRSAASTSITLRAEAALANNLDRLQLMTVPGVGSITAFTILAEGGDLRRFAHYRQLLKFCGMNLSTQQSRRFRGVSRRFMDPVRARTKLCIPLRTHELIAELNPLLLEWRHV